MVGLLATAVQKPPNIQLWHHGHQSAFLMLKDNQKHSRSLASGQSMTWVDSSTEATTNDTTCHAELNAPRCMSLAC